MTDVLVVTGMHRSGTSLIAQLLRALGWDVGPDSDLMPAKPDNPRGFVEHLPAVRINDRVLYRMGGSWHHPPALQPGWEADDELDGLRDEARDVMDILLARGSSRLLLKDPRFSLTLPFWRTVTEVRQVLLVLRPPGDVVPSLLRRGDHLDHDGAARLWTHYLLSALRHAPAARITSSEDLFEDPSVRLRQLAAALGHSPAEEDVARAVRLVDDDLWGRSRRDQDTDQTSAALTEAQRLQAAVTGDDSSAWRELLGSLATVEELTAAHQRGSARVVAVQARLDQTLERIPRLRAQLERSQERAEQLRQQRDRARERTARRDEAAPRRSAGTPGPETS